jgi:predicted RNase H-like HicB family nuclease
MTKYQIILYWSAEDEAFIAEGPELAGCMADVLPGRKHWPTPKL